MRSAERRAESADQLLAQTAERARQDRIAWASERAALRKAVEDRDAQVAFLQRAHAAASDRCETLALALEARTREAHQERDGLRYLVQQYKTAASPSDEPTSNVP